ncbi:WbqC family protein [Francisella philomiragia]|uniref:WbqC family protein n=1 Tax=Francisella philomiragia TaxID=28110 RepID=UPI000B5882C7|nr:WbqC family protein [Francisella philomiragia]MBK2094143.1 WbqC family protein [Francisella philomiragia]
MKKVAILQSNYIPWKGYFDLINSVDEFIFYDDMQYTRRDWRNRNKIKTPQGLKWLTIPVDVKGKYFQKINETKVSDRNWAKNHWLQIKQNYSKAKYFKEYKNVFEELYLNCNEEYLSQINYKFIVAINKMLDINTKIRWSSEFNLVDGQTERLLGICKDCRADVYISGPAAKDYFDESLAKKENIQVEWMDYSGYDEYGQLYQPFEHGVTILDLIFNEGPNATKYMRSFKC